MNKVVLRKIRSIPTLPTILAQIIATLDDPQSSAADLEKIIRNDQALTTKLLAVANSAYYGFRHQITTVRRAVVAIGFSEVRNICLGLSLMGFLHPNTFRDREGAAQLWLHSLAVSEAARITAEETPAADPGQSFTAGLLHDIGKVIVAAFAPDQHDELKAMMQERGLTYREAEREMDMPHARIGKELAEIWDLPPMLVEVVGRHHTPSDTLAFAPIVGVVSAADFLARKAHIGFSGDPGEPQLHPMAVSCMAAEPPALQRSARRLFESRPKVETYWEQLLTPAG